jgi:hypothetical protein
LKLVLLPGMDGTGELFAPLLKHLSKFDVEIIAYPQVGGQDYQTLIDFVSGKLPNEKYILSA